ncbi:MAG: MASE1 domain-containing protein [Limisphaerales bacterium]
MRRLRSLALLAVILALGGVYFCAGKLALFLASVHPSAAPVWPPSGIALAALLILGYRVWPGVFLGAFFVNATTFGSAATSFGIACGNTLEGLIGALLVNRLAGGRRAFERPQGIFKFSVLAGMAATSVSATFGVSCLSFDGFAEWSNYWPIWLTWWLGDMGGALVLAPFLILWSGGNWSGWSRRKFAEAGFLLLVLVFAGYFVFRSWPRFWDERWPLVFPALPLLG